jgi:hypothetical protein
MNRARHIGIVAVSAEGAALCYRTICSEGAAVLGPHARGNHPALPEDSQNLTDTGMDKLGKTLVIRVESLPLDWRDGGMENRYGVMRRRNAIQHGVDARRGLRL